ncbi:Calcium/calmodulin-dependent protein kinase type 1G [Gracilariopsis chorda]|uniref:Calcium/calmodulin-dependent protein kinase type 1G n=1 Tax=Gracilariopsis chorda TaxID=448386 RepID=A0A2V3J4V6_9FLOR|nr:Calcium/calmodulin-dependent protein kinase type 1G [Gracilariopsis chorda]|eukprot:PXF48410.1 Calcium/calmodulin-dependent protein kinase type 1G [Gracilariopsis chorda]
MPSLTSSKQDRDDLEGWVFIRRRFLSMPKRKYLRLNGSTITVHENPAGDIEHDFSVLRATITVSFFGRVINFREEGGSKCYLHFKSRSDCNQWEAFMRSASVKDFSRDYALIEVLGTGSFSTVYKARRRKDCTLVAVKKVVKHRFDMMTYHELKREMFTMKNIKHDGIVTAYEVYNYPEEAYLVLKYLQGGTLGDNIFKAGGRVNEKTAIHVLKQVLSALVYLHENGYAHRDIKMENILCKWNDLDTTKVFLADFGFVNFFDDIDSECMNSVIGTPAYVAPEIREEKPYSAAVDLYALGVMTYRMLCGEYPYAEHEEENAAAALETGFEFANQVWHTLSEDAKSMVRGLLQHIPSKRLTAKEALHHPWLSLDSWDRRWKNTPKTVDQGVPTNSSTIESLVPVHLFTSPDWNRRL